MRAYPTVSYALLEEEEDPLWGDGDAASSKCLLRSAPARLRCLLRARLAALAVSALRGRGWADGRPATVSGALASRLQSRRFHRLFDHSGDAREPWEALARRGVGFVDWLMARPEQHVAVAAHSAFLLALTNAVLDAAGDEAVRGWFATGEMRTVLLTVGS